jgi:hypothetical protein
VLQARPQRCTGISNGMSLSHALDDDDGAVTPRPRVVVGAGTGTASRGGMVLDADGSTVDSLHDATGGGLSLSTAVPRGDFLYLGTLAGPGIARADLSGRTSEAGLP